MPGKFTKEGMFEGHHNWELALQRQGTLYPRTDDIRSEFYRDYSRILHSDPFRRLKHKTQVFFAPQNDHICTRIEHVNHVASVSYTIAKELGLNTELTSAIAYGHDIGHTPFGHEGETLLNDISDKELQEKFWHEQNGLFVCDSIATLQDSFGINRNLMLTYAVRDGIISHCGEVNQISISPRTEAIDLYSIKRPNEYQPYTWEGCIVKISDKISYLGRDIEDAIEQKLLSSHQLLELKRIVDKYLPGLGRLNNTVLMHHLITNLCKNSNPADGIKLSQNHLDLMNEVKQFNYRCIYSHHKVENHKQYTRLIIATLFEFLKQTNVSGNIMTHLDEQGNKYPLLIADFRNWLIKYSDIDPLSRKKFRYKNQIVYDLSNRKDYIRAIIGFIAGMTDNYAIRKYHEVISF